MRKEIIVLMLLAGLFLTSCSMEQLSKNDMTVTYIEEHGLSKDSSYCKMLEYLAKKYDGSREYIQLQDRDNGTIIGKGIGNYKSEWDFSSMVHDFYYTLSIKTKNNKTKFEFLIDKNNLGGYPLAQDKDQIFIYLTTLKNTIMNYMENKENDDF